MPGNAALSDSGAGGVTEQSACSPTQLIAKESIMTKQPNPKAEDKQPPHTGKVANDRNQAGEQAPTQLNKAQRTPDSRHDREAHVGSGNQSQSRRGGTKGIDGRPAKISNKKGRLRIWDGRKQLLKS